MKTALSSAKFLSATRHLLMGSIAALCSAANAHDAFFEMTAPTANGQFLVRFADDSKPIPFPAAKLTRAWGYNAAGQTLTLGQTPEDGVVRINAPAETDLMALEFTNGFFSRTTAGTVEKPMNEVAGAVSAVWAKKTAKYVLRWSEPVKKPLGMQFEIIPMAATAPKAGDVITVTVLWDGKPIEGVKVSKGEHEAGEKTDANGRATYKVQPGRNFVWSERRVKVASDPRYDSLAIASNLIFVAN